MSDDTRARLQNMHGEYNGFRRDDDARVNSAHYQYLAARAECLPNSGYKESTLRAFRLKVLLEVLREKGEFTRYDVNENNRTKARAAALKIAGDVLMSNSTADDALWWKSVAAIVRKYITPFHEYCKLMDLDESGNLPDPWP